MPTDPEVADRIGNEPMSAEHLDDETRERQQLLALLALNSQELPRATRDSRDLHDYLDSNAEAFDALVARHRAEKAARSKARFVMRLAASFAAVAVLTAIVLTMRMSQEESLQAALDRSYAQLAATTSVEPTSQTARPAALGFSSAQRASAASTAFAAGIAEGEARLALSRDVEPRNEESYYILGQWNVLLAAAVRSEQTGAFWLAQREFGRRLVEKLSEEPAASHLHRVDALLATLATQGKSGRAQYELSKEVQLFRAHLAPVPQTR